MFITMTCSCGGSLEIDVQDNDLIALTWSQRFADSHATCGFMAPIAKDAPEVTRELVDKPKRVE
jgi:hypothetical protein